MKVRLALTFEVSRSRREPAAVEPPYVDEVAGANVETFPQADHTPRGIGFTPEPDYDDRRRR